MRKWLKNADSDDIKMVVSGCIAMLAFCTFVLVWFLEAPAPEFERLDCYINVDTGTGRLRGARVFGPQELADVVRAALAPNRWRPRFHGHFLSGHS